MDRAENRAENIDRIVREAQEKQNSMKGKKIKVIRVVTYEGDAEAIQAQLAKSLPHGQKDCGSYSITVVEHSTSVVGQKEIRGMGPIKATYTEVPK